MIAEYTVTVGKKVTPDEASASLFPDEAKIVYLSCEEWGDLVTYRYLVDCPTPFAA